MQTSNDIMKMHRCADRTCNAHAEVWLLDPEGKRVPAGWKCERHAREVVEEYGRVLEETWGIEYL